MSATPFTEEELVLMLREVRKGKVVTKRPPPITGGPQAELRRLRIALNDGRREFALGIRQQKAIVRDTHREWQEAIAKHDQLAKDQAQFEQRMNRAMDALISKETKS